MVGNVPKPAHVTPENPGTALPWPGRHGCLRFVALLRGTAYAWLAGAAFATGALAQGRAASPGPVRYAPEVRLTAQAEGTAGVGRELPDGPGPAPPPLRVSVGLQVYLSARVGSGPPGLYLTYRWRQIAGPAVQWLTRTEVGSTASLMATVRFRTTAPGVLGFQCQVVLLDANGIPTGIVIAKQIRIVAVRSSP